MNRGSVTPIWWLSTEGAGMWLMQCVLLLWSRYDDWALRVRACDWCTGFYSCDDMMIEHWGCRHVIDAMSCFVMILWTSLGSLWIRWCPMMISMLDDINGDGCTVCVRLCGICTAIDGWWSDCHEFGCSTHLDGFMQLRSGNQWYDITHWVAERGTVYAMVIFFRVNEKPQRGNVPKLIDGPWFSH